MSGPVRTKICCIASPGEATLAVRLGAAALGLVGPMPSGPGVIDEDTIRTIVDAVPPLVATFLLTSETDPDAIVEQHRRCGRPTAIQIVARVAPGTHARLRAALPGVSLVQVVHVVGPASVDDAMAVAAVVDALLLDSGAPDAATPKLGGTGQTHDWSVSRAIRDRVDVPVILAGGLDGRNAREAIAAVRPHALDACSRLRTNGYLDEAKAAAFVEACAAPGRELA